VGVPHKCTLHKHKRTHCCSLQFCQRSNKEKLKTFRRLPNFDQILDKQQQQQQQQQQQK
jgi:hypothetical protein